MAERPWWAAGTPTGPAVGPPSPIACYLSWKCRRHVPTCRRRHNVSLQFWPDGSVSPTQNLRCRGSLCRLVSARADILPNFRNSYVEIYYYCMGVHTQRYYPSQRSFLSKNYHNTPQHNRKHNRAPCPTAPSAHASYKGYGCNNVKPPQPPHRNTMIDIVVLGCGPIRTGEGAVAPFIGVHILGEIWPAGGLIPWPNREGRTKLDRLSWSKKSTISQSTVGGLFVFGKSAVGRNSGPVCGDGN